MGITGMPFVKPMSWDSLQKGRALPDRAAAVEWIIANQLGRRNLTPEQKSYLRGKRYQLEKKNRAPQKEMTTPKNK